MSAILDGSDSCYNNAVRPQLTYLRHSDGMDGWAAFFKYFDSIIMVFVVCFNGQFQSTSLKSVYSPFSNLSSVCLSSSSSAGVALV